MKWELITANNTWVFCSTFLLQFCQINLHYKLKSFVSCTVRHAPNIGQEPIKH